jgi:hypothetical protein
MFRHPFQQDQLENMTMSRVTLTDVEWINLNVLVVIRAGLQYDPASTCCRYGLNTVQANQLRELSLDELWSLVINPVTRPCSHHAPTW